jgi:hypothetical protein
LIVGEYIATGVEASLVVDLASDDEPTALVEVTISSDVDEDGSSTDEAELSDYTI